MAKLFWPDDPKLDAWLLKPMLILSVILLGIAIQFQDNTAQAYTLIAFLTLIGYFGSKSRGGVFMWQGLGVRKRVIAGAGVGVIVYVGVEFLGVAVGLPFAIGTSLVLNLLYRWLAAAILEEGCFRSFLYPTFKLWMGNPLSAAILSSVLWSGFHIVALQGSPDQVIMLVFVGTAYCLANEYTQTSIPSYTAHLIRNLTKVI